jgi:catechol 2,3-dioxygenase-like lactoylglutathione lyase family enzyme
MKLNHIDLPVADVAGARTFFESHFGFRCIFDREDGLAVLLDEANFALTLSPIAGRERQFYPRGFHIGFNLQTEEALRTATEKLIAAGVNTARPLGELGGALAFQCHAPGGLLVELAWRPI